MLTTFHHGSKQFICEHYVIIIFTTCFLCGLVYSITYLEDDTNVVGGGSIFYLSMVNNWQHMELRTMRNNNVPIPKTDSGYRTDCVYRFYTDKNRIQNGFESNHQDTNIGLEFIVAYLLLRYLEIR